LPVTGMDEKESDIRGIPGRKICPRCNRNLYIVERGGLKLDTCPTCEGIWFDKSELDELMGDGSTELLIEITGKIRGEGMLCPQCRERMTTHEVFDVYVDHCPVCKGIWMDRGETEKIWEMEERSKHPFGIGIEEPRAEDFWKRFRRKYYDLEKNDHS